MRKRHFLGTIAAVAAVLTISMATMAHGHEAKFDVDGVVGFVGISQDSAAPTSVRSEFIVDKKGKKKSVLISTENEMVLGALSKIQNCAGTGCEDLESALNGARINSLHDSTVKLKVSRSGYRQYTLPTPIGDVPLIAQVISGDIKGELQGTVQVPTSSGTGVLYGTTDLSIRGTATYACFTPFLARFGVPHALPGPLLPCQLGNGQLLPIEMDVVDSGRINIQDNFVTDADQAGVTRSKIRLDGALKVEVEMDTDLDLLVRGDVNAVEIDGGLEITDAIGELVFE